MDMRTSAGISTAISATSESGARRNIQTVCSLARGGDLSRCWRDQPALLRREAGPPDLFRSSGAPDSGTRAFLATPTAPWVPIAASSPPRRGRTSPPPSHPWPRERARVRIPPLSPRHPATSTSPSAGQFPPAQPRLLFLPRSGADASRPPPHRSPPVRRRAQSAEQQHPDHRSEHGVRPGGPQEVPGASDFGRVGSDRIVPDPGLVRIPSPILVPPWATR